MSAHDSMIDLMEKLKKGNYPFIEDRNSRYVLHFVLKRCILYLSISLVAFLIFLFLCIFYDYKSKIDSLFFVIFAVFLVLAAQNGIWHELEVYKDENDGYKWSYKKKFIFQTESIKGEDISKLYIRIQKIKGFAKEYRYYLVIGGKGIDPIAISSGTYNLYLIRSIGQNFQQNLPFDLNFFDVEDFPSYHRITVEPIKSDEESLS